MTFPLEVIKRRVEELSFRRSEVTEVLVRSLLVSLVCFLESREDIKP
jgi:hypothetical protein